MEPAAAPDERLLVRLPVDGGLLDGLLDLGPGFEALSLEGQRAQDLPPRLDKVQVGRILWLEHEILARMGEGEQQHVHTTLDVEVVEDGIDPLGCGRDPALDVGQEVDPACRRAALTGCIECRLRARLQRADTCPATSGRP